MRLGLGLGINRLQRPTGGAPPAFSPASLFTGTDTGFWSDAITPAILWQDAARTIPVTATGQVVRSWQLNTRTGLVYATVPGGSDPFTYEVDSNSRGFLLGNGTTRQMSVASISGGPNYQAFGAIHLLTLIGNQHILDADFFPSVRKSQLIRVASGVPESIAFSGGTAISDAAAAITANSNNVLTAIGRSAASVDVRANGVSNGATSTGLAFNTDTTDISIGRFAGSATGHISGRIYGLVMRFGPDLTTTQITDTEAWLAALMNP